MKYKQKYYPKLSTKNWQNLSPSETRKRVYTKFKKEYVDKKISVINIHTGIKIEFERASAKKTAYGSKIYPNKACVVDKLVPVLKYASKTNWGDAKPNDQKNVLGYLNFKCKVFIDNKPKTLRVNVRIKNTGKFHYSVEVNI